MLHQKKINKVLLSIIFESFLYILLIIMLFTIFLIVIMHMCYIEDEEKNV